VAAPRNTSRNIAPIRVHAPSTMLSPPSRSRPIAPKSANFGFGTPSRAMYSTVELNCGILLVTALYMNTAARSSRATSDSAPCMTAVI
jgi:hypothetical protein